MCGIAGALLSKSIPGMGSRIDRTQLALAHRGPDDSAFEYGSPGNFPVPASSSDQATVFLLHRRLSINDLSEAGRNPMTYSDSRNYITFNGEIYNFKELRADLEKSGLAFSTGTDTEVLLAAYTKYGVEVVHHLDGMFAAAIWDDSRRVLRIFRDRLGIKPLYISRRPEGLFFASEIKALLTLSDQSAHLDALTLLQHLQFQNHFSERTLFQGIEMLPPGHWVEVDTKGNFQMHEWWKPIANPSFHDSEELAASMERLVGESVTNHLVGDVPVGAFLSGGLDSATVAAIASRQIPKLPTFTVGFATEGVSEAEVSFDETRLARETAKHLGIPNIQSSLSPYEYVSGWVETIASLEDPRVGPSVQVSRAAELARSNVTIALSGAGGDELFGGYVWRYPASGLSVRDGFDQWYEVTSRLLKPERIRKLVGADVLSMARGWNPHQALFQQWSGASAEDNFDRALIMDLQLFLHGLLVVEDKLSMAHSLEVRVPMLSKAMIDFAFTIPSGLKMQNGEGKLPLRNLARRLLPPEFWRAPKQGFTPPLASWLRNELAPLTRDLLLSGSHYLKTLMNRKELDSILAEHESGKVNHRMLIWSLISLEIWGRLFILDEGKNEIDGAMLGSLATASLP